MKLRAAIVAIALVGVAATEVQAQKPNFAGTWAAIVDPAAPAPGRGGGGGGGLGMGATIAQDDKTITVTRTTQAGEIKTVYNLDGADSKNTMTMGGNSVEQVSTVKFDGAKMTITTKMNFNGTDVVNTQVWSMEGENLAVETTGMGRGGGAPVTTKRTYKKA